MLSCPPEKRVIIQPFRFPAREPASTAGKDAFHRVPFIPGAVRDAKHVNKSGQGWDLHEFLDELAPGQLFEPVTSGAVTHARAKLKESAFSELNRDCVLPALYRSEHPARRWRGHRLVGFDSSLVRLPESPELGQVFGWQEVSNQHGTTGTRYPEARLSVVYDLLNRANQSKVVWLFAPPDQKAECQRLGLPLQMRARFVSLRLPNGQDVAPHFHAVLIVLGRLGRVLALNEGLLHDTIRFPRRNGLAASEGPRAGATGRQLRKCEQGRQERSAGSRGRQAAAPGLQSPRSKPALQTPGLGPGRVGKEEAGHRHQLSRRAAEGQCSFAPGLLAASF